MQTPDTVNQAAPQQPAMNGPRPVVLIGLGLTMVGGYLLTQDLFHERSARILPPRLDYLMFFGPVIFLVGLTGLLTELLRRSRKTKQVFLQGLRILGVAMLLVGGYPWLWLSVLTRLHGGRPGNEGEGMAGFLIMLFVGLPGLLLTLLSCAIIASRSKAHGQTPDKSVMRPAARPTIAAGFASGSLIFTLCVWAWMLTRPAGTFHDEGGLAITIFYFPATFVVWLLCGLPSVALNRRRAKDGSEADIPSIRTLRRIVSWLIALGLLLSLGTLVIA